MGEASAEQLIKLLDRGADTSRAPLLWVGAGLSIPAGYPSLAQLAEQLREASLSALPEGLSAAETIDAFVKSKWQMKCEAFLTFLRKFGNSSKDLLSRP